MSEDSLSIGPPAETTQTRESNKQRKKNSWLQKKKLPWEKNNRMEGKQKKNNRKIKSGQRFAQHQSRGSQEEEEEEEEGSLVRRVSTGNRYNCLAFIQNNFLPSSSSSKPSASTQNNISSARPSSAAQSSFKPSASEENKTSLPSSSSTDSSFKPSASTQNKGLPQPSCAAGAPNSSLKPSAPAPSLPSSNKGHYDSPKELWGTALAAAAAPAPSVTSSHKQKTGAAGIPTKYLAIDCEMVGTGPKGSISQLARCSVVNYEGDVIYDKFINPSMPVTDYRTRWSGIRRCDLINATPYPVARKEILKLLMGKVVIGHAVHNDFKVLGYSHPTAMTRDTARIPLLNQRAGFEGNQSASLKRLTKAIFNRDIQTGKKGHSSVEDAKATMELYKVVEEEWERTLASRASSGQLGPV
ncbi:interferon-stimulated 20 kDa exonuclease-like 2 [Halichoeres trimaculatus]|uniref:interferon-stimulated 20 kDa exonuclease-like 2 n=1 Tax=Halichoeres trimaculatus TaxID=147232 RepID=UPI003D9EDF32